MDFSKKVLPDNSFCSSDELKRLTGATDIHEQIVTLERAKIPHIPVYGSKSKKLVGVKVEVGALIGRTDVDLTGFKSSDL